MVEIYSITDQAELEIKGDDKMKTIRLGDDFNSYRINNEKLQYLNISQNFEKSEWVNSNFQVGSEVILYSKTNVSPNALRAGSSKPHYYITDDDGGIPGNMNRDIKRYHGWRGTSNGISIDAHGLRRIEKIRTLKNGQISITLSNDIAPELK